MTRFNATVRVRVSARCVSGSMGPACQGQCDLRVRVNALVNGHASLLV
jgi:hypothetical protein